MTIGTSPARITGNTSIIAGVLPFAPTTRRTFAADRVTSFVRVYQGGDAAADPVSLVLRIVDAADRAVVEDRHAIDAAVFAPARSADIRWNVPLGRLTPGSYLYVIEAARGTRIAKRSARFEVR